MSNALPDPTPIFLGSGPALGVAGARGATWGSVSCRGTLWHVTRALGSVEPGCTRKPCQYGLCFIVQSSVLEVLIRSLCVSSYSLRMCPCVRLSSRSAVATSSQWRWGGAPGPHQECDQQRPGGGDGSPHRLDPERRTLHRFQQAETRWVQAADVCKGTWFHM